MPRLKDLLHTPGSRLTSVICTIPSATVTQALAASGIDAVIVDLEHGAVYHDSAEALLPNCDFLSINAPSTRATVKFLNAERIALLPDGAIVANTARGNMVDDEALIAALKSGKVAAAGLDVFDGEPKVNKAYMALDNTFLLPHLGSATVETRDSMGFCCLDNLDAFFAGRTCPSPL